MARMIDTIRSGGLRITNSFADQMKEVHLRGFYGALLDAVPIVADNVLPHYFNAEDRGLDHMPSLMPPFDVTWVEARFGRGVRFGMIYMKGSDVLPGVCRDAAHVAVCLLFLQSRRNGKVYGPEIQIDVPLDERGYFMPEESTRMGDAAIGDVPHGWRSEESILRFGTNPKGYSVSMKDWVDNPDNREPGYEAIKALLFSVGMMNCSNVGTVEVVPAAKLSKKREKRYGKPLTRYRVIQVKPHMTSRGAKHSDSEREAVGEDTPLHICRGHFKTYEEDRPLMGRHSGTFWWKSQVRGSKAAGEIIHTYEVE